MSARHGGIKPYGDGRSATSPCRSGTLGGKGAGTEAQRQLVRYLFAHSTVVRIEADTEAENIAEQRALEKAGFTREGVLRSVSFRDGRRRDGVRYSILRGDVD